MKPPNSDAERRREARAHIDRLRIQHLRLQRELERLQLNPRRNQLAIQCLTLERDAVRVALRIVSRELIKSI